jgi:hypothetical protein
MSKRIGFLMLILLLATPGFAQDKSPTRDDTRELLRKSLNTYGPMDGVSTAFKQSEKAPYNFSGTMTTGIKNADYLEIVLNVTEHSTISVRVYPHYNHGYINLDKVKDANGFMRKLLSYNDTNFLFWGADDTNDVFTSFNFTLESGYPDEAVNIVLRSIHNTDKFIGELRPMIDGTSAVQ